jgi:hypothetical protein
MKLLVYVRDKGPTLFRNRMTHWDFRLVFNEMLNERKRKRIRPGTPFAVGFKIVRDWETIKFHYSVPDYSFSTNDAGEVSAERRLAFRNGLRRWKKTWRYMKIGYHRVLAGPVYRIVKGAE